MSAMDMNMSVLDGTTGEGELRALIREYARSQDGYDARLYDLWERWNEEFFEGLMVPSLIQLTDPGQTHRYGCCTTFSGLAGIRSAIKIRPSILDGTLRDLKHGSRNWEGLRRFLEDVLLHEMIHQWHHEVTGEFDDSYSGHGPAFSAKANEIGEKLGLPRVGRTCKQRDCADKGLQSPSQWPHDVRPASFYLGAHVPASVDKPKRVSVPLDLGQAIPVLRKFIMEMTDEDLDNLDAAADADNYWTVLNAIVSRIEREAA
jgi:hypothetical protein